MTWKKRFVTVTAVACGLILGTATARYVRRSDPGATRTITMLNERLGQVEVEAPVREPRAFVVLLSDVQGVTPAVKQLSAKLVSEGAAVLTLSTPNLLRTLDATANTDCDYALGLFEELSQTAQKALDVTKYKWPVVVGVGQGGTIAYLSEAQSPVNTAAGAVSVGFEPTLRTRLPFCGDPPSRAQDGAFVYRPPTSLTGRWIVIPTATVDAKLTAFTRTRSIGEIRQVTGGLDARLTSAAKAAFEISNTNAGSVAEAVPVEEIPAKGADTLVVFYSGDGGWRDIDKSISEYLNRRGVAVVGVDSLRYFWREKSPAEIGTDLDRLIADYRKRWGVRNVALVGYSMGAGILPFAWDNLSDETRRATKLIALLSLDPKASFEVSISGYLGLATATDTSIGPAARTLPHDRVMCFYGAEERDSHDSGCLSAEMQGAMLVERPGGHHFDGNYEPIARMILGRLNPSYAGVGPAPNRTFASGRT